ncbi:MAG: hypothetical protein F6K65_17200 [Moorea sp. SIO3C2]|nr:hypothetical protein [Moorena sp. SIO3C2]
MGGTPKTALHRCANSTQQSAVSFMAQATSPVTSLSIIPMLTDFIQKLFSVACP